MALAVPVAAAEPEKVFHLDKITVVTDIKNLSPCAGDIALKFTIET
jgi:hypothetical protein